MTKLLITGANGQLGSTLKLLLGPRPDMQALFTDIDELDLTDARAVSKMVSQYGPDYIINCAAYTAVDAAEENEQTARAINAQAVKILADAALQAGARMIHISTDYVFAGTHFTPYTEDDLPDPQSVYGLTKLEGEQLLRETLPEQSVILRTAWLYSPFGKNFVKTMLRLAREKDHVNVVCDQIGTPTCALTLGIAILAVIDCPQWHPGIFNLTDQGVASWYDLAEATMRLAGVTDCTVIPVTTEEYPTRAIRPAYSVLSKKKFTDTFHLRIPHWERALELCIRQILQEQQ